MDRLDTLERTLVMIFREKSSIEREKKSIGTECFAVGSSWLLENPKFSTSFLKSHTQKMPLEMGCSVLASMDL